MIPKSFLIFTFFLLMLSQPLLAQSDSLGVLDRNESFDVFYGNAGESFVVRHVKVVRLEKINDLEFLVFISDAGFNAKGKEGFILFSTINAIVPSNTFTINNIDRIKQY